MANDTREDHGNYYPGAKVIVSGSGTSGTATDVSGKVDRVTIGEIGDAYTLKTVKEKVDKLIKAVAPVASCLAAMLYVSTAMAATEVFEDIPSNARVVVSEDDPVAMAAIPEVVGAATNAAVETAKKYADAAVAVEASNRADTVEDVLVHSKSYTDTATNALTAKIPVVDLGPYATKSWVEAKGYVTSDALGGVATKDWIGDQGYLTLLAMAPYATMDWVLGKGYATASVTNGLASAAWTIQGIADEARRSDARGDAKFATKSELDALKRMYADTNGVTRLWSEDGLTMTDGTGVVWNVTWNVVTNWTSLSNGVVFAQFYDESMDYTKWVSKGIYTNAAGKSSSAAIAISSGIFSVWLDAHAGSTGTFDISDGQILVEAHDYDYNDTFSNSTVRVPAFTIRSMVVTNAVGYVTGGGGGDYLPLTGGTLTGDLSVGEDHSVARKLIVASDSQGNGITLQGGSGGSGSSVNIGGANSGGGSLNVGGGGYDGGTVYIGGSQYAGGKLTVQGGGNSGGVIEVTEAGASIKKDGKEVATEEQLNAKADKTNVYTKSEVDAKVENAVLPTNPTFSNAVLAVGLNIDTNSVAVLNEISATFGGFPIERTATTVGGLLAALAAAVAWLRKKKIDKLTVTGMSKEVTADGGIAKLDDFFTESTGFTPPTSVAGALKNSTLEKSIVLAVTKNFGDADNTYYGSAT